MADKLFELEIISPNREFYKGKIHFVEFNTTEGYMGIYADHTPTTVIIDSGLLVIHEEVVDRKAALHAGFAQITKDKVMILAEIAEWPDEIDLNRAQESKIRAERRMSVREENVDIDRVQLALRRSLTRISSKN